MSDNCTEPEWWKSGQTKEKEIFKDNSSFCLLEKTRQSLIVSVRPLQNHFHIRGTGSGFFILLIFLTIGSYYLYVLFAYLSSSSLFLLLLLLFECFACMNTCEPCACVGLRCQKRVLDPLDLELQSFGTWVQETNLDLLFCCALFVFRDGFLCVTLVALELAL